MTAAFAGTVSFSFNLGGTVRTQFYDPAPIATWPRQLYKWAPLSTRGWSPRRDRTPDADNDRRFWQSEDWLSLLLPL